MLLITKGKTKTKQSYPTMFMIINGLLTNLCQASHCFQQDILWKILQIASNHARNPRCV